MNTNIYNYKEDIKFWREDNQPKTNIKITNDDFHPEINIDWGTGNSNAAKFAYQILLNYCGQELAKQLHQEFKWMFIAGAPQKGGTIKNKDIIIWIEDQLNNVNDDLTIKDIKRYNYE